MQNYKSFNPLVSVIVPVYNVEKYIKECVESVLNQNYKKIEVIIINDGTPDCSGEIATRLANKDERLRVIHTENKGVSSARNLGLNKAKGDYVVFVDADDILMPDFITYMLTVVERTKANFVMSRNCFKYPLDSKQLTYDNIEILTSDDAAIQLLYPGKINIGCWNKMFKKEFLVKNNILFPKDFYMGEGLNFIIKAAQLSNCVGVGNRKVYKYRVDNPTSATTVLNVPKYFNALAALDNIDKTVKIDSGEFKKAMKYHRYLASFAAVSAVLRANKVKQYKNEYESCLSIIRQGYFSILKCEIPNNYKLRILFYCISPSYSSKAIAFLGSIKRKIFR